MSIIEKEERTHIHYILRERDIVDKLRMAIEEMVGESIDIISMDIHFNMEHTSSSIHLEVKK